MRFSWTLSILATSFLVLVACQTSAPADQESLPKTPTQPASQPAFLAAATATAQAHTPTRTAAVPATPTPTRTPKPTSVQAPTPTARPTATAIPLIVSVPTIAPPANQTDGPAVTIGGVRFAAEIANTSPLRTIGLSGRPSLPSDTGMLFIFDSGLASNFWMNEMQFPLDFVWIGADCTVVDITEDVPNPESPSSPLPLYASSQPAAFNFEINAGKAKELGLATDDDVRFNNIDVQGADC